MLMPGMDIRCRGAPLDCGGGDEQSRVVRVEVAGRVYCRPDVREEEQS